MKLQLVKLEFVTGESQFMNLRALIVLSHFIKNMIKNCSVISVMTLNLLVMMMTHK